MEGWERGWGVRLDAPFAGKVLSCRLENLVYVEEEDEEDDDDDDEDDEEEDEDADAEEGRKGKKGKGGGSGLGKDVVRAARLLGVPLPQLGLEQGQGQGSEDATGVAGGWEQWCGGCVSVAVPVSVSVA